MNKIAAYMTTKFKDNVATGYVSALKAMGWKVYVCSPRSKMEAIQLIEQYGVGLIFASSKYHTRQLPIDLINQRGVGVVVEALPICAEYVSYANERADDYDPSIIGRIGRRIVWTPLVDHLWLEYMAGWLSANIELMHLPYAGNLLSSLPENFDVCFDAAFSEGNDVGEWNNILFHRLAVLQKSYGKCFYSNAIVCPNLHTPLQRQLSANVNDRFFDIPMHGGLQVVDMTLGKLYYSVDAADNFTQFISIIEAYLSRPELRLEKIGQFLSVSLDHSYFNRLYSIFDKLGMEKYAEETSRDGNRIGQKHVWDIEARLEAQIKGGVYESDDKALARG